MTPKVVRVAAQLYAKGELRPDEVVRHTCEERRCVAEAHLKLGTQKDNIHDAIEAGTHYSQHQTWSKLNWDEVREIRRLSTQEKVTQTDLSRKYRVSQALIWKILKGDLWKGDARGPRRTLRVWPGSSGKIDWETPKELFDRINTVFNFGLDVCASAGNTKCPKFYTREEDGLKQPWVGSCWCNPPYGKGIDQWLTKAWCSAQEGATVACLIPGNTATQWWHRYVRDKASSITFIQGKIQFVGATQGAPFASALVVFAPPGVQVPDLQLAV